MAAHQSRCQASKAVASACEGIRSLQKALDLRALKRISQDVDGHEASLSRPRCRPNRKPMSMFEEFVSHTYIGSFADLLGIDDSERLDGVAVAKAVGVGHDEPRSVIKDCQADRSVTDWNPPNECVCRISQQPSGIEGENHVVGSCAHAGDVTARRSY
jgi:hypothetical protein